MKIKAIIIEDETPARVTLKSYLERYFPQITLVGEAGDLPSAHNLIQNTKHDILFLDIQLEDGLGIELLETIKEAGSRIVFTTAFNNYTITAFKHKAFGYLLKPISPIDFKEIVNRVIKDILVSNIYNVKIKIPTSDGFRYIDSKNIIRCESESNYTRIYLADGSNTLVSKTLKLFEDKLNLETGFLRVHQSHLINSQFIDQKQIKTNHLVLKDGKKIPIARSRKEQITEQLERIYFYDAYRMDK